MPLRLLIGAVVVLAAFAAPFAVAAAMDDDSAPKVVRSEKDFDFDRSVKPDTPDTAADVGALKLEPAALLPRMRRAPRAPSRTPQRPADTPSDTRPDTSNDTSSGSGTQTTPPAPTPPPNTNTGGNNSGGNGGNNSGGNGGDNDGGSFDSSG